MSGMNGGSLSGQMVANAGIAPLCPFIDSKLSTTPLNSRYSLSLLMPLVPVEKLDTVYTTNVRGIFLCLKHAALQMIKQGRGGRLIGSPLRYLELFAGLKLILKQSCKLDSR